MPCCLSLHTPQWPFALCAPNLVPSLADTPAVLAPPAHNRAQPAPVAAPRSSSLVLGRPSAVPPARSSCLRMSASPEVSPASEHQPPRTTRSSTPGKDHPVSFYSLAARLPQWREASMRGTRAQRPFRSRWECLPARPGVHQAPGAAGVAGAVGSSIDIQVENVGQSAANRTR